MMFGNVRLVRETFPEKKLLFTEGTVDSFKADDIHNWRLGEYYGRSMINDFNDGAVGWTDWNVLLDERGGPNHVGNYCFAPVHADTRSGELIYTNSYHYIGHFSKFIRPGWVRIEASGLPGHATAYKNPATGEFAIVVINPGADNVSFSANLVGFAGTTSVTPWETSAANDLQALAPIPITANKLLATVAPGVTTFVGISESVFANGFE